MPVVLFENGERNTTTQVFLYSTLLGTGKPTFGLPIDYRVKERWTSVRFLYEGFIYKPTNKSVNNYSTKVFVTCVKDESDEAKALLLLHTISE